MKDIVVEKVAKEVTEGGKRRNQKGGKGRDMKEKLRTRDIGKEEGGDKGDRGARWVTTTIPAGARNKGEKLEAENVEGKGRRGGGREPPKPS